MRGSGTECEDRCTPSEVNPSHFYGSPCRGQWDNDRKLSKFLVLFNGLSNMDICKDSTHFDYKINRDEI